jgi:hypothetical protein
MTPSKAATGKPVLASDEPLRTTGSVNRPFSLKDNPEWCEWAASKIEELELEVSELTTDNKILEVDVLLKAKRIDELEAKKQEWRSRYYQVKSERFAVAVVNMSNVERIKQLEEVNNDDRKS